MRKPSFERTWHPQNSYVGRDKKRMTRVEDFTPLLRQALAEAEAAGFAAAAKEARGRCFVAYTTSSEWLGHAVKRDCVKRTNFFISRVRVAAPYRQR